MTSPATARSPLALAMLAGLVVAATAFAAPARAALPVGAKAPDFTTAATLAGGDFTFALADALKKGPVVLYFYPKAFTQGCTIEAHEFSAAQDEFKAAGATVMGMSADDMATLHKFSLDTTACSGKFAIGVASKDLIKQYDVVFSLGPISDPGRSNRTSYVIAPDGQILLTYSDLKAGEHVSRTLAAVKAWKAAHPN